MKTQTFFVLLSIIVPTHSRAGLVDFKHKWEKREVKVCWIQENSIFENCMLADANGPRHFGKLNSGYSSEKYQGLRQFIQKLITREYTSARTGIIFSGWGLCPVGSPTPEDVDAGIALSVNEREYGYSGVMSGNSTTGKCSGRGLVNLTLYKGQSPDRLSVQDRVIRAVIHEFGHLAGLVHEDDVLDRPEENARQGNVVVGGYDPHSIMSYDLQGILFGLGTHFSKTRLKKFSGVREVLLPWKNDPPSLLVSQKGDMTVLNTLSSGDLRALKYLYP